MFRLGFIQDDPVFPDEEPDVLFRDNFAFSVITENLQEELIQMLEAVSDELNIIAVASSWGFPDNLRVALLVLDQSGNISTLRFAKQALLPQPDEFPILRLDTGWTFKNSEGDAAAIFTTFLGSRTPLAPGTIEDPIISFTEEFRNEERIVITNVANFLSSFSQKAFGAVVVQSALRVFNAFRDLEPPTIEVITIPEEPNGQDGWYKKPEEGGQPPVKCFALATDTGTGMKDFIVFGKRNGTLVLPVRTVAPSFSTVTTLRVPEEEGEGLPLDDGEWDLDFVAEDNSAWAPVEIKNKELKIDLTPPICRLDNQTSSGVEVLVQDITSGIKDIEVTSKTSNVVVQIPPFLTGATQELFVFASKSNSEAASFKLKVTDVAGNVTTCDPVITLVIRERGKPVSETFTAIPEAESFITIQNGAPGLMNLLIDVNGTRFSTGRLGDNEETFLDVSAAMVEGDNNVITLTAWGRPGDSALVVISD